MPSTRQTLSFLQRRLTAIGIQPDARRGQNFLIDLNLLDLLVDAAEIDSSDVVLEVGTGTGSLTGRLAELAGRVITVEVDARLQQLAREELGAPTDVQFLQQDVLRNKNRLHDAVIEAVQAALGEIPESRLKLVANLPYSIATPLISNLLHGPIVPDRMVVTIQKELADRILAAPETKDYGSLSVWVQSLCEPHLVRILPPSAFWPRPKVHSAILRIDSVPEKRARIERLDEYHTFVRAMFFHRRKFLRSVMLAGYKGRLDKPAVDRIMARQGLGPDSRTEQLSVPRMLELFASVCEELDQAAAARGTADRNPQ